MIPIELFNSWYFGGLMIWHREGRDEEIRTPVVLLYETEDGFLSVPPGYQLWLAEPNERLFPGPLEIRDGELVFPLGKIVDMELVDDIGIRDAFKWQKDIAAKGHTVEQEREDYRKKYAGADLK